jgi:glyoxylase-like metal-dependent hydrolase (beta-lactamase superfamily II)
MAAIAAAPRAPSERAGLLYPHGEAVPAEGQMLAVADGIFWLRMPLPFGLDHINLWVLDGGDHWAIVDTGVALPALKAHWRALFEGPLAGKPVGRLIVTHYHPDHIGLAGWFVAKFGVPLEMSRGEFMLARTLTLDIGGKTPPEVVRFYASHGWSADAVDRLEQADWGGFARLIHRLPQGYRRLTAGQTIGIGGRTWEVVVGAGHSPEHVCLLDRAAGLLISGDQVLPRITSNVSVYPTEPMADPLGDWLDSIEALRALPAQTLVLPAHNEPFAGLHERLDQLAADHHRKLEALLAACREPMTARDSFATLFRRPVVEHELQMATGEALAHLHWLERRGQLTRVGLEGGAASVHRFQRTG